MHFGTSTLPTGCEAETGSIELPVVAAWDRKPAKMAMSEFGTQSNFGTEDENSKNRSLELGCTLTAARWGLPLAMCLFFGSYVAVLAAFPVGSLQNWKENFLLKMTDTPFGLGGKLSLVHIYLFFQLPVNEETWIDC